jgi:hypothetical protein
MTILRLVRGDASPEELAAVVAVLASRSGSVAAEEAPEASAWAAPQLRRALPRPGPGAWVASGLRL